MNNGIQNLGIAKPRVTFDVLMIIEFRVIKENYTLYNERIWVIKEIHIIHSKIDFGHAPRHPKNP